jgi:hypothetical protein
MYHLCDPGCIAVMQSIIPTLVDGWHQQQPVGTVLDQLSDGADLHPSSLAPHLVAVFSEKNVKWMGSHRPVGKLESLADRIAAASAIAPDSSPDSAVTPSVALPWFLYDGPHVTRYSRHFYGGGILDQRLPPPHPSYPMQRDPGVLSGLDGYVSDGDHSYQREWSGFQTAPSVRRLLSSPSHSYWHPLPGLPPHRIARIPMRIPNVHRDFDRIQSEVLTDDEDGQSCFQLPPDFPYDGRRRTLIRRSCYEGNGQLEWFLGICAGCRAGDEWSQLIFDQEVVQQTREIKDLLKTIRHDDWGRQFAKAFSLSETGKGLLTMASIRNAILGCTTEAGYHYRSPISHRIKRQRGMPDGSRFHPRPPKSTGSLQSFADDVPMYPNHEFHYTSMVWRKERARLAGHLRRISQLLCSVQWTPYMCADLEGYHSDEFPRRLDPVLVELNIRRLMGDAAFSASETARLNWQLDRWERSTFRAHIWWNAHHFSHFTCPLLAIS